MEPIIIILFCVLGASFISLIILLLTLKQSEPGKTVVVIKDKRNKKQPKEQKKAEPKEEKPKKAEKQKDELVLKPVYAAITFGCDKCNQKFLVQEQNLAKDVVCPKCKAVLDKQEAFKNVLKAELKSQTKEQELFLGMCYLYGVGVKKDDKKAYLFVNLSAYNGDEVAKEMLQNYYCEDIAKLTKENIKDATSEKLEELIKEQKLQYNKAQFEPKTLNELHNYAIDYFWWATYHRMNCFDVDELARVGSANINSNRILNMVEGFEEIDLTSLESRLAFAYLDVAANNGRYDLYAELGFAYVGFDNDKAKKYLKKGIACGDERSKELYAVYFEGKTIEQVRIEKLEAPKKVLLIEQKPAKASKKTKETKKAKDAEAKAVKTEAKVEAKKETKPAKKKETKKAAKKPAEKKEAKPAEKKPAAKKAKPAAKAEAKTEVKPAEAKPKVVKKKKAPAKKAEPKEEKKSKDEILSEIKEKSSKDVKPEEKKADTAEKLAAKVEKLEQKVEKLEEKAETTKNKETK